MKFIILCFALMTALLMSTAQGAYQRFDMKGKFPSQYILEKTTLATPKAATTNDILSAVAGATSAAPVVVTTFLAQPDFPRNLVVTPGGTTADVAAGSVVVVGKDILGKVITENFTFTADQSTAVTGNRAFASITSITFPAEDSPFGATWSVGVGAKLGLAACLDGAGWYWKGLDGGADLTGSTVAANATDVSLNTVIPNPAANGSKTFDLFYYPNYRCAQ